MKNAIEENDDRKIHNQVSSSIQSECYTNSIQPLDFKWEDTSSQSWAKEK